REPGPTRSRSGSCRSGEPPGSFWAGGPCAKSPPMQAFAERRKQLLDTMGPGVAVLPSAPVAIRNNDVEHEYRQDSDVFYLTGFDEPETVVVLGGTGERRFTLFVRPRDPEREVW